LKKQLTRKRQTLSLKVTRFSSYQLRALDKEEEECNHQEASSSCDAKLCIEGGLFFFFFFQFCDVATALCHHHPQEELAKFGYRSATEESRTF
jgi:hypothetical protein